jgi:hypothetical protein
MKSALEFDIQHPPQPFLKIAQEETSAGLTAAV